MFMLVPSVGFILEFQTGMLLACKIQGNFHGYQMGKSLWGQFDYTDITSRVVI